MAEEIRIGIVIITEKDGNHIVDGFTNTQLNNHAFMEEMKHMGCVINREATEYASNGIPLKRLVSCVNAYFGKGASMSSNQQKWKDKLLNEVVHEDCLIKKDKDGIFLVDAYQLSGTINEIKKDLLSVGVSAKKVVNKKRVYIELPAGVSLSTTNKKKKKPSKKKSIKKDNKNLVEGDIIKYVGRGFEGFSKFNPKAKFFKYNDDGTAVMVYKQNHTIVKISDITKV